MFSTTPPSWQCQYVAPKPTISPPGLHNARYEGWVGPPIQLPHNTPSRHPYEVATNSRSCNPKYHIWTPCLLVTRTLSLCKSALYNFWGAR
ncbi:hypothetical protein BDR04DRAFT_1093589 [Suillus decipiens]|nr:hypothetical protein BDR04DRAFT_1093589 [Suillus decipiens]